MKEQKYACILSYDGTNYAGFQVQPNAPTVQGEIEKVLQVMHRQPVRITGAGRTDAGVHARGQVFHFQSGLHMSSEQWTKALNAQLPQDIRIMHTEEVATDFHARYDSVAKEYHYVLDKAQVRDPLRRLYAHHVPHALELEEMHRAARFLIGTHDFQAFSSSKTEVQHCIRTIQHLDVYPQGDEWIIRCIGNGFLYNMVRIIAGTLIEVGKGNIPPHQVKQALQSGERSLAGATAPSHGLCLWKITYDRLDTGPGVL